MRELKRVRESERERERVGGKGSNTKHGQARPKKAERKGEEEQKTLISMDGKKDAKSKYRKEGKLARHIDN